MATKTQKRIQEAYAACYRLCESDRDACQWLERSLDAARRGEKQHRRSLGRYRLPIADAARFFAVKWFLETGGPLLRGYDEACRLREDCLYAKGARDACFNKGKSLDWALLTNDYADVVALDYVKEFTT